MQKKIESLIKQMTLEEKVSLLSGMDTWHTQKIERLKIPAVMMSDGPHGLRKQVNETDNLGIHGSIKAVCFPVACATACSFDKELLFEMGAALGEQCQNENVAVLLGPGANLKRSPLCGRNFEYFSEDPYLSSEMAAAFIKGVQSKGTAACLKHFAANNQETRRMSISVEIGERALRELYLSSFEKAVKEAKPQTIMCSYNRINGEYASESPFLLNKILRDEWGYEGTVVSDWGAVNERVLALKAGMDIEMPDSGGINDRKVLLAVENGEISEEVLDKAVSRILRLVLKRQEKPSEGKEYDLQGYHKLCEKIETESIVLLKNENNVLPLKRDKKYAFIGEFAKTPRYQGGGSSHVNSFYVEEPFSSAEKYADITFAKGYTTLGDEVNEQLIEEAKEAAKNAEAAIIFAGLPDSFESEGFDREHLSLPNCQNKLIEAVARVQKNTVVVLFNGSSIVMPWIDLVPSVLEAYLGGEAVGAAVCNILFGDKNPGGKLAETFPRRLSDNPSFLNFPGELEKVQYSEGLFIGYRYYDKKEMSVLFPFGHGLSYTEFTYSSLRLSETEIDDTQTVGVTVTVKNTGKVFGKETVQLYVSDDKNEVIRPIKELKGFEKTELMPGESKEVSFTLDKRAFSYWNEKLNDWYVGSGEYSILIGASSRDIRLSEKVTVKSTQKLSQNYHINSTLEELLKSPRAAALLMPQIKAVAKSLHAALGSMGDNSSDTMRKMMLNLPLRGWIQLTKIPYTQEMLDEMFRED